MIRGVSYFRCVYISGVSIFQGCLYFRGVHISGVSIYIERFHCIRMYKLTDTIIIIIFYFTGTVEMHAC